MPARQRLVAALVLAAACLGAASCSGSNRTVGAAPTIADSAGVRVVVNPPPESAPVWTVSERPTLEIGRDMLEIGGDMVDPPYALFQATGAVRLTDGTVVIANSGTLQLRYFDAQGTVFKAYGGKGDGPNELRDLGLVGVLPGDSVVIRDIRHRTILTIDDQGTRRRTRSLSSEFGLFPIPVGILDDGSVLLQPERPNRDEDQREEPGLQRYQGRVVVAGPDGIERRVFGDFPSSEGLCEPDDRLGCKAAMGVIFGRRLVWSAARDRVALATTDSFSVRVYDGKGTLLHIVRQPRTPLAVKKGDFEAFQKKTMAHFSARAEALFRPLIAAMPRYSTYPAFAAIRVDRDGDLWVEDSRRPGDRSAVWQVFDREGVLIGKLTVPEELEITDSGADYVLGIAKDENDVQRLRLYGLTRTAGE